MRTKTLPTGGFWMLIEDISKETPSEAPIESENAEAEDEFRDSYDFYPDSGF